MAKIQFTAFVEDVKGSWLLKTAEPHRKQVDGKWETAGRTFRNVKPAFGVEMDMSQFSKGDRIEVIGTESTVTREFEGKKYYDLVVKAEKITPVVATPLNDTYPIGSSTEDDSMPF